jgi:hypothetical protein
VDAGHDEPFDSIAFWQPIMCRAVPQSIGPNCQPTRLHEVNDIVPIGNYLQLTMRPGTPGTRRARAPATGVPSGFEAISQDSAGARWHHLSKQEIAA